MSNEIEGNDGLTDSERDKYAARYRAKATGPLRADEIAAIQKWRAAKTNRGTDVPQEGLKC